MKTLITGVAGTGKSTIAKALKERSFYSVDFSDVKDMCFWQDANGKRIEYAPIHSKEWFSDKKRICDISVLKGILAQQEDVVVAGVASGNAHEYLPLFDKVILLQCSPEDNVHRLETRDNPSGYGKTKTEQEDNLEWKKGFDPELLVYGAIPVSTEGELNNVVDNIVELIKTS